MSGPSFLNVTIDLLTGFLDNLELFGLTLLFSLPLGLMISFGRMSKNPVISFLVKIYKISSFFDMIKGRKQSV